MRFLIAEFAHESNCFCSGLTGLEEFKQLELHYQDEVLEAHQGKRTVLGGFLESLTRRGHQIVPTLAVSALPSGPLKAQFYSDTRERLIRMVKDAGQLDGVLLSLHGAMSVEEGAGVQDPEGDLVSSIRAVVRSRVPIVAVLDLHSDTTDLLLNSCNITLAYNEEPHHDAYDRGIEAAGLIQEIRENKIRPTAARERVPMLLPAANMSTDKGPMHELHKLRARLEQTAGVLDISIHGGFCGSDQLESGFSVVCTTDRDPKLARQLAQHVATEAWKRREEFLVHLTPVHQAVRKGLTVNRPVGLIDECDDPAGGGSADSVAMLRAMIECGVKRGGISTVKDPEVARLMAEAGEGAMLSVRLGAKTDSLHGEPIEVTGRVARVHRGRLPKDTWSGETYDPGIAAVLDVQGILIVVTEHKLVTENIDVFNLLGFDVTKLHVVGFKGLGLHIRQALTGKISEFILVDGVGVTHPDVRRLGSFKRLRRPTWPIDSIPDDAYTPLIWANKADRTDTT
jgi:microcystin degradation protein MlrC